MEREQLRLRTLKKRDALPEEKRAEFSLKIHKTITAHSLVEQARTIFLYYSFRSEVQTHNLFADLCRQGTRVALPRTTWQTRRLDAVHITDPKSQLISGCMGILEPSADRVAVATLPPQEIDLVLLPGSVFDEHGGRYGYGGGFYDRYVAAIPHAIRMALAFELQVADQLQLAPHDQKVDYLVTEKRLLHFRR